MNENIIERPPLDTKNYKGEWLALNPETYEIIAHDRILINVIEKAKEKGFKDPIFHGVPENDIHHVEIIK